MGDFNFGPANPDIGTVALWEDNYSVVASDGYDSANLNVAPFCTLCPTVNPLQFNQEEDVLVDHIFVREGATSSNPRRILDDPITFEFPDGSTKDGFLSDHYGYKATVNFDW